MHHTSCYPSEKSKFEVLQVDIFTINVQLDRGRVHWGVMSGQSKKLYKIQKTKLFLKIWVRTDLVIFWKLRQIQTVTFALQVHHSTNVKNRCCKRVRRWVNTGTHTSYLTNLTFYIERRLKEPLKINRVWHHASYSALQSGIEDITAVAASENWPKYLELCWYVTTQ